MNSPAAHGKAGSHYVLGQYKRGRSEYNFFHLLIPYLVSLAVTVLVTLYDSFLSLGAPGMNCWGVLHSPCAPAISKQSRIEATQC